MFRSMHAVDLKTFKTWVSRNSLEVVFFNEQHQWRPVLLCNELGVRTGAYIDYYTRETVPFFLCYDFLICNTKRHYSVFEWHPQAFYVPWGTDTDLYKPDSPAAVSSDRLTFFHSSGMSPVRKGTDFVLRAFERLSGKARLVIHSQVELISALPGLRSMIQAMKHDGRLICHTKSVPAPGLYREGDVYVYPSRLDGIGLTIAEALASGLPVITSDNPPMNEFVNHANGKLVKIIGHVPREDGYYWPQCIVDVDHLKECMQEYVDNREQLGELKTAARNSALEFLEWSRNAGDLPSLFETIYRLSPDNTAFVREKAKAFDKKTWSWKSRVMRCVDRKMRRP